MITLTLCLKKRFTNIINKDGIRFISGLLIRVHLNPDPDPDQDFFLNPDPVPESYPD
jgi:hypothetical protein